MSFISIEGHKEKSAWGRFFAVGAKLLCKISITQKQSSRDTNELQIYLVNL